jgi:transposase-like protein
MASHKLDLVRRRRLTPQQRQRLLARYHRSQLGQREFAARHGVGLSTLGRWLEQERAAGQPAMSFKEVMLPNSPTRWALEIVNPQGWTVRLAQSSDLETLSPLLLPMPC